jgi:4-hydroxybenzoyl-CoA thioesterase
MPPVPFTHTIPVRFGDCDVSQMVYYPRILHYCHVMMEALFEDATGTPYARIVRDEGVGYPTGRLDVEFVAPLRLGDAVEMTATVERIGTRSVDFCWEGRRQADGVLAFRCRSTSVAVTIHDFQSTDIPPGHREALAAYLEP